MGCFAGLARLLLVVLNIVFLLGGLAIAVVGFILRYGRVIYEPFLEYGMTKLKDLLKNTGFEVFNVKDINLGEVMTGIAIGLIIGGLALACFAFIGCCGACCKVAFMLWLYVIVLVVILVAEIVAIGVLYGKPELIKDQLKGSLKDYKGIASPEAYTLSWNIVMIQFQCCGVDSYQDFDVATNWNRTVQNVRLETPTACCKILPTSASDFKCATTYDPALSNGRIGCFDILWHGSLANTTLVVPILVCCFIIQLAFIAFSITAARAEDS